MIFVEIEDPAWGDMDLNAIVQRGAETLFSHLGLDPGWDAAVLACSDARIAALNGEFRGRARPTNVLSWPSAERGASTPGTAPAPPAPDLFGDTDLGDIALAHGVCHAEAAAGALDPVDHVTHLVIHGLLHLLGYDHQTDADAALMEGIERRVLGTLGISDPYWNHDDAAAHP